MFYRLANVSTYFMLDIEAITWLRFGDFLLAAGGGLVFLPQTGSSLQQGFGWQNKRVPKSLSDNYFLSHTGRG